MIIANMMDKKYNATAQIIFHPNLVNIVIDVDIKRLVLENIITWCYIPIFCYISKFICEQFSSILLQQQKQVVNNFFMKYFFHANIFS
jgi:hypothetical protein